MNEVYKLCLGRFGLSYQQARNMTMWEFYTKLGYYIDKKREKAYEYQILAGIALNPHTKRPKNPDRLIKIPGYSRPTMSKEERKQDIENLMRLYRHGKRTKC